MIRFRDATGADWPHVCSLLSAAALPTEDLGAASLADFLVAEDDGTPQPQMCGFIGLEKLSGLGLVRSLVVGETFRGRGIASDLLGQVERRARTMGITELWLLTIDADGFFAARGFAVEQREGAPDAIRNTEEFRSLCPGDAVLMRKSL
jgi:amino-acid N-acetyltransferase